MDKQLLLWINQSWANPWLDTVMHWLSLRAGFALPFGILILAFCVHSYGRDGAKMWLWALLAVAIGDGIGAILKDIVQQARPCFDLYPLVRQLGRPPGTPCGANLTGMPSNHSLDFFTMATILTCSLRTRIWVPTLLYAVALCVALSRIYLGKHYPSQVAAGAVIGIAVGLVMGWIGMKYFRFVNRIRQD